MIISFWSRYFFKFFKNCVPEKSWADVCIIKFVDCLSAKVGVLSSVVGFCSMAAWALKCGACVFEMFAVGEMTMTDYS